MRQRNITGHRLTVAVDPPVGVDPGDVIDHPDPLMGFAPVVKPEPPRRRTVETTVVVPEEGSP